MYLKGHYHSPYPNLDDIKNNYLEEKLEFLTEPLGMDMNSFNEVLLALSKVKELIIFSEEQNEEVFYYHNNFFFRHADAWIYAAIILNFKPNRIIEVGSGFSTALAMDINKKHFNEKINILSIDPNIERLYNLMENKIAPLKIENLSILDIPLEHFKSLKKNDILFIDSSHVLKQNSDVNYILFQILPILNSGVIIHFHDVFLFNYPKQWFIQGRSWNESYALRAFLSYNNAFRILFLNKFVTQYMTERCMDLFPELLDGHGGSSLYIIKN